MQPLSDENGIQARHLEGMPFELQLFQRNVSYIQ